MLTSKFFSSAASLTCFFVSVSRPIENDSHQPDALTQGDLHLAVESIKKVLTHAEQVVYVFTCD